MKAVKSSLYLRLWNKYMFNSLSPSVMEGEVKAVKEPKVGKRWIRGGHKLSLRSLKTHSVVNLMTLVLLIHFLLLERFRKPSSLNQSSASQAASQGLFIIAIICEALSEMVFLYPRVTYFTTAGKNAKLVLKTITFTNSTCKDAVYNLVDWAWQENFLPLKCSFYSIKWTLMM